MHKAMLIIFSFALVIQNQNFAQSSGAEKDSVDITVIDSYVTPEIPHTFLLSFFTSRACKSKVVIDGKYTYPVSDTLADNHNLKIDLTKLHFKEKEIPFYIIVEDSSGSITKSDINTFELPGDVKIDEGNSNFLLLCLFGATVFALPAPVYVTGPQGNYFSLTKEIPLISFRSKNFIYPAGYFSAEYSYIFKADQKNFMRIGYKELIEVPFIEYLSPGIDGFTNFKGYNGISMEISAGLFRLLNTFTLYARYRYSFKPGESGSQFNEISIGLYSSFFSVYF
ncbi:MAG: hypothetical protein ACYCVH_11220 [Ignavibacteriaceae bacterium]